MIFTLFDRSALYQLMANSDKVEKYGYYAHEADGWEFADGTDVWNWASSFGSDNLGDAKTNTIATQQRRATYMDQVMPFNITLVAQNEYGYAAFKTIVGVEVLNEGGGLSVDDITNEEQTTYVAKAATAWVPFRGADESSASIDDATGVSGETSVFPLGSGTDTILSAYQNWIQNSGRSQNLYSTT